MASLDTPSNITYITEGFVCIPEASGALSPCLDDSATSRTSWNEPDSPEVKASWKSMFAFTTRRHLRVFIPAWFFSMLAGAIKSTISIFLGFIFDNLAAYIAGSIDRSELMKSVSKWCTILTSLGFSSWLLNGGLFALWLVFGELQAKGARERLFAGLLRRDMEWYDLQRDGVSSLLVRIQTQVRELQMSNSQPLGFCFENIASALAAIGIALYYSWKLTLVLSTSIPIAVLVLWLISRRLQPAIDAQKRELNEASKYANTAINAVDTVKVFNGQDYEVWQYTSAIKTAAKSYLIQANANALQMGVTRFLLVVMFVAGFWYGLVLYKEGELSPGNVLTTFYAFLMANQAVGLLLPQWLILSKGMSAGKTLKQIMGEAIDTRRVSRITGSRQLESFDGDIEVVNLSFAYPSNPKQPALVDVNFFFPAGETTFLFGRSGSGKSTLSNLLLKFYDPSSGMIIIDGHPIQTLDEKWLRDNITLVQQQSVLFNETLLRNITFGCKDGAQVSKEDVRLACQAAMLIEVIHDLPDGLETVIGSGGDTLSGGQKQRVAIARARLRDTPILILDEATSALDHVNKGLVMEAIREWRKDKTTIIITHDPSQIYEEDFVYVLDKGTIVEEGYRKALTKNPFSLFASLVNDQKEKPDLSPIREDAASTTSGKARMSDDAPRSSVESLASDTTVEYGTANTEFVKNLRRFSSFFYNPDSTQQVHHQNKRMSLGMASAYANTLRADTAFRRPANQLSRSTRGSMHLQKPLPSLPSPGAIRSLRPLSLYPQIGVQAYEMAGTATSNTTPSRAGTAREHYYRRRRSKSELNTEYVALMSGNPSQLSNRKQKKGQKQSEEASLKTILSTVWPNLNRKDRITLILGFGFAFISAGCTPAFSYVLAKLFNSFYITENQDAEARKWALTIFGIASLDGTSSYFFHYYLEYSGRVWVDALRGEALKRILAQPRSWFDNDANSPNLLNECLDRNAEEMRNIVGRFAGYAFVAASMIIICIIWALIVCWKLTVVSLASVPVIYAITRAFETVSGKWERKTDTQASVIGGIITETFSNIRVVRALTLESYFQHKHSNAVDAAYRTGLRRGTFSGIFFGMSESTGLFLTTLILYYGSVLVGEGSFTFDNIVASITLLLFGIGNANETLAFIPQIASSRATATQMLRLASLPLAAESALGARALASPLPIRMHNLCFSYPAHPNFRILRNLSLTFNANTYSAIVGPSGSGKSTIAALLLGLYPPSPTPVYPSTPPLTFANHPISQLSLPALRSHMALVPQFPAIFPASIAQNITYGLAASSPLTSSANVEAAARGAGIHDFVASLPHGYATRVGEGGQTLSGGQLMRVAIARALVRRPRVLVLDEPTAALDRESADAVGEAVKRVVAEGRGVAVVVITHDLRMMREAGRVAVVEKGVVVEDGSWEELRLAGGGFERLVGGGEVTGA